MISSILIATLAASVSALPIGSNIISPIPVSHSNSTARSFNVPIAKRSHVGTSSMTPGERLAMLKANAVRTCAKYGIAEIMGAGTHLKRDLPKGILQMGVAPSDT